MRLRLQTAFAAILAASSLLAQDRVLGPASPRLGEVPAGPYAFHIAAGGPGVVKPLPATSEVLEARGIFTLTTWVDLTDATPGTTLLAGIGDPAAEESRFLGLVDRKPVFRLGKGNKLQAPQALRAPGWHLLAATFDGSNAHLFVDALEVAHGSLALASVQPQLRIAPVFARLASAPAGEVTPAYEVPFEHFGGDLAGIQVLPEALPAAALRALAAQPPDVALLRFDENSRGWPVQVRAQAGYAGPQDPSTMPRSRAPLGAPRAQPVPPLSATGLSVRDDASWLLRGNWSMTPAPKVSFSGEALSATGVDVSSWWRATVPGTALTTMVDRGVYPDPDFGLNNLAIPESLARQDYWYRTEFRTPPGAAGHSFSLTFEGINYAAEVWLNGHRLGEVTGAFLRGRFDVTALLRPDGSNALAVRISPPPHPGIPQEQSLLGGPGENGGAMCLDGPTFVATEGWDWIPAVRDRNSGIWQDVVLARTDRVQLGDPQVITHLALPDTGSAEISVTVPVYNTASESIRATVRVAFEGVAIAKEVTLAPGESLVHFTPADAPELRVPHPRLWWPNGYGRPELYHLQLTAEQGNAVSDQRKTTFGIREVTYELSLFDSQGKLRRVEVDPTLAAQRGEQVVNVRHEGMRETAEYWAASLTQAGEHSPAVRPVADQPGLTDLVLKVNGVRIAARGGNWGMDDSRKRVSREHLEPYFRLQREANLNIIRNWVGQDTEETFYQLADEYGMMVWNDFWESTEDYNVEAQDVPLFLANARDVVRRFRNHPSIVIWCGRNEGVPQPILNEGLIAILQGDDGTRYYTPGSNRINLRNSGPYRYQDASLYYTTLDKGFSVELGIASLSTREALEASIAPADRWPISDAWAYHDWHQSSNGDVHPLTEQMDEAFGAATDLADFERKAQMFNYVEHRAIFEGFNQHLWSPNSGRMLWMTHPAWPSNVWQIYSSDYDTQASFYGVKKACEPLHIQLDLSNGTVAAVNTTNAAARSLVAHATMYTLDGKPLFTREQPLDLQANGTVALFSLALPDAFAANGVVLVKLELTDASGASLSRNVYWLAGKTSEYRQMNQLGAAQVRVTYTPRVTNDETQYDLTLTNTGPVPALAVKLTLLDRKSRERLLPAFYSDNYVSVLPGESLHLQVNVPKIARDGGLFTVRGWNVAEHDIAVTAK